VRGEPTVVVAESRQVVVAGPRLSVARSPTLGRGESVRLPAGRSVLHVVLVLALVVVVAPFAVYAMPGLVGADHSFVVLSGSMEPAMSPGDVVLVAETAPTAVAVGDVVTFTREGQDVPTTHRVVDVTQREDGTRVFTTKGDANEDADAGAVLPAQLVGEVLLVVPLVGYVVQFANTPTGFALLVGAPLGLLVLSEAWSIARGGRGGGTEQATTASTTGAGPTATEATTPGAGTTPPESVGEAAGATETGAATASETTGEAGTYQIRQSDLRLTLVVLACFAAYAVWTALSEPDGLRVTVAVGVAAATALTAALYVAAGGGLAGLRGGSPAADLADGVPDGGRVDDGETRPRPPVTDDDTTGGSEP
jgi:signal peptidase